MLNFRKIRKDYSPAVMKEGKALYEKGHVQQVKIVNLDVGYLSLQCRVAGSFDNSYECEIEIDRKESAIVDSDCHCPYEFDCQHLAAVLFYLEEHLNEIIVAFSKEEGLEEKIKGDEEEKDQIIATIKEAATKETIKQDRKQQRELLEEYISAAKVLGRSPFFLPKESLKEDEAELALVFSTDRAVKKRDFFEVTVSLRLPYRSKPLNILEVRKFFEAVRYEEPLYIAGKKYFFTKQSFQGVSRELIQFLLDFAHFPEVQPGAEGNSRVALIDIEAFGCLLASAYERALKTTIERRKEEEEDLPLPGFYHRSLEEPILFARCPASLSVGLEYLEVPDPKILLKPFATLRGEGVPLEELFFFESAKPGLLWNSTYYPFAPSIHRNHLQHFASLRSLTVPEPLFGTFVENSLPEMLRYADVQNRELIERFVTLPFAGELKAECEISYLEGVLEASLKFIYGDIKVPALFAKTVLPELLPFVTEEGILARSLTAEQKLSEELFQDFLFDFETGHYITRQEKRIVEFMTETVPTYQGKVHFDCPQNLLDRFIYDDTTFTLSLRESKRIDQYEAELSVNGYLSGTTLDLLWECLSIKRSFIELPSKKEEKRGPQRKGGNGAAQNRILVLDLERLAPVVKIFDELGLRVLENHKELKPLWSLTTIDAALFQGLPIEFSISKNLEDIQAQMLGTKAFEPTPIPKELKADLRSYQVEGINWLERLRSMYLNGILADDMGLGKTVQAIAALTQYQKEQPGQPSIIICPTSLLYNWKEELGRFNPKLKALVLDGTPQVRKKMMDSCPKHDVVITSYSLLQKDVEAHKKFHYGYVILDEAQNIKNRGTRNAKSVKMIPAKHRLILTGTPIENSLEELWSLFDFLMPGLLSSYDRFVEKYIRQSVHEKRQGELQHLKRKLSPFILRRMKKDVLSELPPVSEIIYHCNLSPAQEELYHSYAKAAREELEHLVDREGYEKVQIHVLATLTRLKQICCHPAIFAKENVERGDSAKYDLLLDLLENLIAGKHKTVIFSQYTRMLQIIRDEFRRQGIPFEYLDGASKNRLNIVKKFNEDENIPIFLVSLKAGGSGLNLVGADTVIHYDMWWNPAVENQATDRVHRIGQKSSVSSYKLVTLNTIEEKILALQNRKRNLVTKVVSCDEEAISKLTWEEVLELLQT